MKKKCKHLLHTQRELGKKLYYACYELEKFVEELGVGYNIGNTLSDFQPSYEVSKTEGEKIFVYVVNPRVKKNELVFFVTDDINYRENLRKNSSSRSLSIDISESEIRTFLNPYQWDFENVKNSIENIDVTKGFFRCS